MTNLRDTAGEQRWRWTLRIAGLTVFLLCAAMWAGGREIPVVLLLVAAGSMGLDSIQGFELRRRRNGDER